MIKCIVFDIGGVLIDYKDNHFSGYFAKQVGISKKLQKEAWYKHLPFMESGKITRTAFWNRYLKSINKDIPHKELSRIEHTYFKPMPYTKELAMKLKKNYKIGILSNWGPSFVKVDKKFKVTRGFDFSIISFRTRYVKPMPSIYKLLIKKCRCRPEEIVFIDDYPACIKAAKKLGIRAIKFRGVTQLRKDLKKLGVRIR